MTDSLSATLWEMSLVDHHVHGAYRSEVDRRSLEVMLTEATAIPQGASQFDSQVGFAIRKWCAPILGLHEFASADDYVARRLELGNDEVNARLLPAARCSHMLNDTGAFAYDLLDNDEMTALSGSCLDEIVRLEWAAVELVQSGVEPGEFPQRFRRFVHERTRDAVGMKSIIAYLHGFEFDPACPSDDEVVVAANQWIRAAEGHLADGDLFSAMVDLTDPVLLRFFLWVAVERGLPLQIHSAYGSHPIYLHRANPMLLTDWFKAVEPTGVPILLLHNYPYHREAGYLAQIYTNVYLDVGLATNYTGVQSAQIIAESMELAPFTKLLYSSDAWGPSELHHLGSVLWRRGMEKALGAWVDEGVWSLDDAVRVAHMVGRENAIRVYGLDTEQENR